MKKRGTLDASLSVENNISPDTSVTLGGKKVRSVKSVSKLAKPAVAKVSKKSASKKVVQKTAKSKKTEKVAHLIAVGDTDTLSHVPIHKNIRDRVHISTSLYTVVSHLDHGMVAHNVARYAGTFFVVVGAIFTMYHFNTLVGVLAHENESLQNSQTANTCVPGTVCSDPGIITPTDTLDLRIDGNRSELSGRVPLSVTYTGARQVTAHAYQTDSGSYSDIGSFSLVNNNVWTREWDTERLDNGVYRIKVTVATELGTSFTYMYPEEVRIMNIVETDSAPSPTPSGTGEVSTTTEDGISDPGISEVPKSGREVSITLPKKEFLQEKIEFGIYAPDAQSLRVYIDEPNTATDVIGYATLVSTAKWKYLFNAQAKSIGEYSIRAEARYADGSTRSDNERFIVLGIEESNESTTSPEVKSEVPKEVTEDPLNPVVTLTLPITDKVSGSVDVFTKTEGATFVELYGVSQTSKSERFLGLFTKVDAGTWRLRWDTRDTPNGSYQLFAKARHPYGDARSNLVGITILNNAVRPLSPTEVENVEKLEEVARDLEEAEKPVETDIKANSDLEDSSDEHQEEEEIPDIAEEIEMPDTSDIEDLFRESIKRSLHEYAEALRQESPDLITRYRGELDSAVMIFLASYTGPVGTDIEARLRKIAEAEAGRIERRERIARERIGDEVLKDSDSDTITDFDEVNIYKTNPYSADTDGDGYLDGIEILSGFDPLSDSSEANVLYESPRESTIPPDEVLRVESIAPLDLGDESLATGKERAVITGRGFPLSFVTLHIYSTPIVVTVKTDENGLWEYVFDKELEDGTHEVYATLTDNRGAIVAQSEVFSFVKTAEAFSPVGAGETLPVTTYTETPSILTPSIMLAIASLSVVSLGLVLILLGLHIDRRSKNVLGATPV